ncbi:hypothetical protein HH308_20765 [Gordonia sp. TBRC 11910]|uniref:Uncharacterized protein n=1 Tax=Gordonia asplenii TaxID=2725283 RepID=A0A848L507_9ACTN|nr:hypothetical protein [Gordonia asplenii]NMO03651.1 hypothetical protein [Gordonia asplenii]
MNTQKIKTSLAAAVFGAAILGGAGYGLANATTSTTPAPATHHSTTTHAGDKADRVDTPEPGDTSDAPGSVDKPEPGDTPDAPGAVDKPEPGDTPDH